MENRATLLDTSGHIGQNRRTWGLHANLSVVADRRVYVHTQRRQHIRDHFLPRRRVLGRTPADDSAIEVRTEVASPVRLGSASGAATSRGIYIFADQHH